MRVPVSAGSASTCASTRPREQIAHALSISTAEVERVVLARRRGRTATSAASASATCSRPASTRTPTGCSSARSTWARTGRARSSAAPGTSAPARRSRSALPGASLPGGLTLERRKLRGQVSEGMILAERRARARHRPHRDHACSTTGSSRGRRSPTSCRSSSEVLELEPTGNRPDLLSVYGIAREVAALLDGELAPPPGDRSRARTATSRSRSRIEDLEGCPRYVGRLFRDVTIGAVAALAEGAAARAPACARSRTSSTSPTT